MSLAVVGIGTNLGDRDHNIARALAAIQAHSILVSCSPVYESQPAYVEDQPLFLNLACKIETTLAPHGLLGQLKQIERQLGRTPTFRYGPRLIDLDLLFYEDLSLNSPDLILPHPRLAERAFVLLPLTHIASDWIHPQFHLSVQELCQKLGDVQDQIWLYSQISAYLPR